MEQLFARQGRVSRAVYEWMCRHRSIAQWIALALEPQWPVTSPPLSAAAHTANVTAAPTA